ncbi:PREDICTED: excitatory amino acid transporter 5-like [Mesitornis unicolor]|uniref:excitatory amino acid transporter 5-like n=1 Tax=Mesitornis unicolor TaxID=54374 RepID=UPI0005285A6E|nr:PREDICTED: excitatory amino acid transporter 5-like [Mesitornis unicolor]
MANSYGERTEDSMAVALDAILARIKDVCKRNGLLILSVLSVTIGCLLGFFLRTRRLSQQEISYFQFPGELLMRMLKMLILPLVVSRLKLIHSACMPGAGRGTTTNSYLDLSHTAREHPDKIQQYF